VPHRADAELVLADVLAGRYQARDQHDGKIVPEEYTEGLDAAAAVRRRECAIARRRGRTANRRGEEETVREGEEGAENCEDARLYGAHKNVFLCIIETDLPSA
jgi:hypothetical protein